MYTILPVYQEKMPSSFIFDTVDDAVAGAEKDFADPHTPETKGFMVVKIEKAIGVNRSLNTDVTMDDFIQEEAVASGEGAA
jgi:hypothetical protein